MAKSETVRGKKASFAPRVFGFVLVAAGQEDLFCVSMPSSWAMPGMKPPHPAYFERFYERRRGGRRDVTSVRWAEPGNFRHFLHLG